MAKQQSNSRKSGSKNTANNNKKKSSTGISKKQIKAKTKASKVMLEKLNRETTTDDVNHVVLINNVGSSNPNNEEDKLIGLKSLKNLKKDHKSDIETSKAIKDSKEKTNQDIAAQLELISGFKF